MVINYTSPALTPEFSNDPRRNSGTEAILTLSLNAKADGSSVNGAYITLTASNDGHQDLVYSFALGGIPSVVTVRTEVRQPGTTVVADEMWTDDPQESDGNRITAEKSALIVEQLTQMLHNTEGGTANYPDPIAKN